MQKLQVYQIDTKIYLLKDVKWEGLQQRLCAFIDNAMAKVPVFLEMHQRKGYKPYVFSCLHPIETSKVYRADNIYSFSIRTIDDKLADFFSEMLVNEFDDTFKALTNQIRVIPRRLTEKLYTITAVLVKSEEAGYWRDRTGLCEYQKFLTENLIKKYNYFMDCKLDEDFEFIREIKFLNKGPIAVNFKGIKLLADKFDLYVTEDETSQELAYLALGTGLGHNNSRGNGYVNCKWYE